MRRVAVIGVGVTKFGKHERTSSELFAEAAADALADAEISADRVQALYYGNVVGSETEHQLHTGPQAASILGIPRDSYVNIPGHGQNKINSAEFFGGPQLTIQTVEQLTGCHFDYYTLTSFDGFQKIVNDFGGITMKITENTAPDHYSHYNFRQGATYHMTGGQALAFARDRHTRPAGDFDRSLAQGKLIVAALAQQQTNSRKDPGTLLRAMGAMYRNLRLDIPVTEAFKLGLFVLKIKPSNVTNAVMKGGLGQAGGASIVTVPQAARNQFVDICSDGQLGG